MLSARLKARVVQRGIDEVKIKAMLECGIDETTIWDMLEETARIEKTAKAQGVAYKAALPNSSPALRNAVNAGLRRFKEKQLDAALMAVGEAFENQYDALIDADDHAGAQQLLQELAAWLAGRRQPAPPVAAAKTEQNGLQQAVATLFPHLADTR